MKPFQTSLLIILFLALSPITSPAITLTERPIQNDYTNTVVVGTDCGKGIEERKSVLNATNAYLPRASSYQEFVACVDAPIYNMLASYVDHEQSDSGIFMNSSIPMLTASSIWTRLYLPCVWTNGTANYIFTDGSVSTTNMLEERQRVLAYLKWTKGTDLIWTNVTISLWSNTVLEAGGIFYDDWVDLPDDPLTFPSWWEPAITNGPPNAWFSPAYLTTVDDVEHGTEYVSNSSGAPSKAFVTSGWAEKFQTCYFANYEGMNGFWNMSYEYQWSTLTYNKSHPAFRVPYTPTQIAFTGDVYVSETKSVYDSSTSWWTTTTLTNRERIFSSAMMSSVSNSYYWVGSEIKLNNDLFVVTNHPFVFSLSIPDTNIPWAYSVDWHVEFGANANVAMAAKDVVYKWNFAYCRP